MPGPERALLRIVDRLGARRLASDPALVRVALKDLFPEDPLIVSVLTAAAEHGVVAALLDDRAVPLEVLGPRLASNLRRSTGIDDARARWAVGAWARALLRVESPLLPLPRDGSDPAVVGIFDAIDEAATLPAPITDPFEPTGTAPTDRYSVQDDRETVVLDERASAPATASVEALPRTLAVPSAETLVRQVPEPEAPQDELLQDEVSADAATVIRADETDPESEPEPEPQPEPATDSDLQPEPGSEPVLPALPAAETVIRPVPLEPEDAVDEYEPGSGGAAETVVRAPAEPPTAPSTPASRQQLRVAERVVRLDRPPSPVPAVAEPRPPRRRRRRRLVLLAVLAVVALIAAGGAVLAITRGSSTLVAHGAVHATIASGGHREALTAGRRLASGDTLVVGDGPLELTAQGGVMRLAAHSTARVEGSTAITLRTGRAFVLAGATGLEVRSAAGTADVSDGRLLVGCTDDTECAVTTLDKRATVATVHGTVRLAAHESVDTAAKRAFVVPDALRVDPWISANEQLDRSQHRTPTGIDGPTVVGTWTVSLQRSDLPFEPTRTLTVDTGTCTATGCTVRAHIAMSDDVARDPISGTVESRSADGERLRVDYGTHTARCQYVKGTSKGGGVDGKESVVDDLRLTGSGDAARLAGSRTTTYTPTGTNCDAASFTAAKTATLAGRRGDAAASDLSPAAQQLLLNYVVSPGTGCVTGVAAPKHGIESDVRCSYAAKGAGPSAVEFSVYGATDDLSAAYESAIASFDLHDTGECGSGPCEGVAPGGHGRLLLAEDGDGAVLVTYDPRDARLLVVAHGSTTAGLLSWWQDQQRTHSVYRASPLPRVGV